MFQPADYQLADMLGIAGSTIGIIIAGAILLQCFTTQYTAIFDRYRNLTGEFRGNHMSDPRRGSVQAQIDNYRWQILLINSASLCVTIALFSFLLTVSTASLSVAMPKALSLRTVGTTTLFTGLAAIAVAVVLELITLIFSRRTIASELSDFHSPEKSKPN